MAVLAVFIPVLLLGVVLALGRYEELLLPPAERSEEPFEPFVGDGAHRAL
ncbi:hypothetical protein AB0I84_07325 [Streptomyces spectabilis]|uniref:Uncharacterized protein n=1 Tax=Streptomyces spectabilis TaxID=68270 RepID=A0A7W8EXV8_STRST|nr:MULTISPECIES: hypothetical protein [Streptomyces]MBB5107035.1 hypothetical protein [Streptomyces spectabilis]MCI3906084.1 hypothetical protein [Streptomyces spectabilis]GGV04969.1 hypothetical protein GCM10010245_10480 [Streptomyces spectabilis]